jgi:hypothetical protein
MVVARYAAAFARLAIFAIVARLQPVTSSKCRFCCKSIFRVKHESFKGR